MPIWQEAMEVACDIFEFTRALPQVEDFALTSQLRRSSNSMPANIAEAFGRFHRGNKLNFYYTARGSLCETISHLRYAEKVGYLALQRREQMEATLLSVWKQMNQIIHALRQQRR
jgi:four helix bundle protein